MADTLVNVRIVFKEPHREVQYRMTQAERDRLAKDFCASTGQNPTSFGSYAVENDAGDARRLALRFSDVLFID